MPNAYMISSSYRGDQPEVGQDPSISINETSSLTQTVATLTAQFTRRHLKPGSVDKLYIIADSKKGIVQIGQGLTVSNAKTLAPIAPYLVPGRERVGAEFIGFKIGGDVANRDIAQAVALTLQTSVLADGETFYPKKT